jgi:hypothetical protein
MTASVTPRHRRTPILPTDGALVWIDHDRAIVTRLGPVRELHVREFSIPPGSEAGHTALREVVRSVLDVERLVVLGSDDMRTTLEREYVTVTQRPDRIRDVEWHPFLPAA